MKMKRILNKSHCTSIAATSIQTFLLIFSLHVISMKKIEERKRKLSLQSIAVWKINVAWTNIEKDSLFSLTERIRRGVIMPLHFRKLKTGIKKTVKIVKWTHTNFNRSLSKSQRKKHTLNPKKQMKFPFWKYSCKLCKTISQLY